MGDTEQPKKGFKSKISSFFTKKGREESRRLKQEQKEAKLVAQQAEEEAAQQAAQQAKEEADLKALRDSGEDVPYHADQNTHEQFLDANQSMIEQEEEEDFDIGLDFGDGEGVNFGDGSNQGAANSPQEGQVQPVIDISGQDDNLDAMLRRGEIEDSMTPTATSQVSFGDLISQGIMRSEQYVHLLYALDSGKKVYETKSLKVLISEEGDKKTLIDAVSVNLDQRELLMNHKNRGPMHELSARIENKPLLSSTEVEEIESKTDDVVLQTYEISSGTVLDFGFLNQDPDDDQSTPVVGGYALYMPFDSDDHDINVKSYSHKALTQIKEIAKKMFPNKFVELDLEENKLDLEEIKPIVMDSDDTLEPKDRKTFSERVKQQEEDYILGNTDEEDDGDDYDFEFDLEDQINSATSGRQDMVTEDETPIEKKYDFNDAWFNYVDIDMIGKRYMLDGDRSSEFSAQASANLNEFIKNLKPFSKKDDAVQQDGFALFKHVIRPGMEFSYILCGLDPEDDSHVTQGVVFQYKTGESFDFEKVKTYCQQFVVTNYADKFDLPELKSDEDISDEVVELTNGDQEGDPDESFTDHGDQGDQSDQEDKVDQVSSESDTNKEDQQPDKDDSGLIVRPGSYDEALKKVPKVNLDDDKQWLEANRDAIKLLGTREDYQNLQYPDALRKVIENFQGQLNRSDTVRNDLLKRQTESGRIYQATERGLKDTISKHESIIFQADTEIGNLKTEVKNLKERLSDGSDYQKRLDAAQTQYEEVNAQLQEAQQRNEDLKMRSADDSELYKQLQEAQESYAHLESQKANLETELGVVREGAKQSRDKVIHAENELSTSQAVSRVELHEITTSFENLKRNSKERIKQLEEYKDSANKRDDELQKRLDGTYKRLQNLREYEQQALNAQAQKEALEAELTTAKNEAQTLQVQINHMIDEHKKRQLELEQAQDSIIHDEGWKEEYVNALSKVGGFAVLQTRTKEQLIEEIVYNAQSADDQSQQQKSEYGRLETQKQEGEQLSDDQKQELEKRISESEARSFLNN